MDLRDVFWIVLVITILLGVSFLTIDELKSYEENEKQQRISYMEQAGTGVVLGKRLVGRSNTEVAIRFKDTILYSNNKEWYYLLKEGDSIKVEGKRIFKVAN